MIAETGMERGKMAKEKARNTKLLQQNDGEELVRRRPALASLAPSQESNWSVSETELLSQRIASIAVMSGPIIHERIISSAQPLLATRASFSRKRNLPSLNLPELPSLGSISATSDGVPSVSSSSSTVGTPSLSQDGPNSEKRCRHDSLISSISEESDSQFSVSSELSSYDSLSHNIPVGGSLKRPDFLINNSIIGDYRIIGCGKDARAIHMISDKIFDCKVLTPTEALTVSKIICRLDDASRYYKNLDVNELRAAVFPDEAEVIEEYDGRMVLFTPIFKRTLHEYAHQRSVSMTEAELHPVFQKLIRVIFFCHSLGIILRDLKPKKIVYEKSGELRLSSICECVVCDDPDKDFIRGKFGSPAYVPPEVLSGVDGYGGKAADIWGFGVLMYLLLLGRYPFYDKTPVGVFTKIKQAKVDIPRTSLMSRQARIILYNALRKCPEERPTAEDLDCMPWPLVRSLPSRGQPRTRAGFLDFVNTMTRRAGMENFTISGTFRQIYNSLPSDSEEERNSPVSTAGSEVNDFYPVVTTPPVSELP